MAVTVLLKLAGFTNNLRDVDMAHQALIQMQPVMSQYPLGFGQWLQALAYGLSKPREIAIDGPSCLVLGFTLADRPLHILCSRPSRPLVKIVTLYEPDPDRWIDYRKRRS